MILRDSIAQAIAEFLAEDDRPFQRSLHIDGCDRRRFILGLARKIEAALCDPPKLKPSHPHGVILPAP